MIGTTIDVRHRVWTQRAAFLILATERWLWFSVVDAARCLLAIVTLAMSEQSFSLGVTYWPRRRAMAEQILCSWSEADPGALRDELGHIAELGFNTLRLELRWAEAQPGDRVNVAALRGLERALDRAADLGLRAVIGVLGGSLGGALHLPAWAVGYRLPSDTRRARRLGPPVLVVPDDQPAILAGEHYRREPARDLYREPEILEAQRRLLDEAIGNLAAHPAAATWLIGADLERVRRPASARLAASWWADLAGRARALGARAVVGAISPVGLSRRDSLRPDEIVAADGTPAVSVAPLPPLAGGRPGDASPIAILHAIVAGLLHAALGRPIAVIVADIGAPTAVAGASGVVASEAFGRAATMTLSDEEQQAALLEEALATLHREGAGGAWLAAYRDIAPDLWRVPPADRSWWARTAGLVSADGREKPAAAAVQTFARRLRAGLLPAPAGPPTLPLDPERHWHDPAASFRSLWREMAERR